MALSENGWPTVEYGDPILHTWVIPTKQGNVKISMRNGSVGFILAFYVSLYAQFIEPVVSRIMDDWGHATRPIRNGFRPSNHYSATAVDLNATRHPLGKFGTVVKEVRLRMLLKWRVKNLLRWGGDYNGRKDEMHVEARPGTTIRDFEVVARKLMRSRRGKAILAANPGQRKIILS